MEADVCECLEYSDGSMHLCEVCGPMHKEMAARLTRLRDAAKWVADDAYYTAPEIVIERSRDVWVPKLLAAIAESEGP